MLMFHGTNQLVAMLAPGSWVTDNGAVARSFAEHKVQEAGGTPVVLAVEVDEGHIDWDVLSAVCGVDDERGTLIGSAPVARLVT